MENKTNGYDGVNAPIVIFFGQSVGGKTSALVRLIRFLNNNYTPEVSKSFYDCYYQHREDINFDDIKKEVESQLNVPSYSDLKGTIERTLINIVKKDVKNNDKQKYPCRFLEAPGEDFVDLHKAGHIDIGGTEVRYNYLTDAMSCKKYRKVWVFFFDVDFTTNDELKKSKEDYVNAMKEITIAPNDKIIVLLNKIDKIKIGDGNASLSPDEYEEFINKNFNNVLKEKPFSTKRWSIFGLRDPYKRNFELLGYSSYHLKVTRRIGEEPTYEEEQSENKYPYALWNTINRAIKNRF